MRHLETAPSDSSTISIVRKLEVAYEEPTAKAGKAAEVFHKQT